MENFGGGSAESQWGNGESNEDLHSPRENVEVNEQSRSHGSSAVWNAAQRLMPLDYVRENVEADN